MANFRQIHTQIWRDSWFSELEPDEKLLFIYLFSNESTSLSGIYRITKKFIAFETGIDKTRVDEILKKFENDKKVYFEDDIIWVVNMRLFHETKSIKVQKRISNDIDTIPDCDIKQKYIEYYRLKIPYRYPIDTETQEEEEEEEYEHEYEHEEENNNRTAKFAKNANFAANDDDIPETTYKPLEIAFVKATGLTIPIGGGAMTHRWVDNLIEMQTEGVTPDEITAACESLQEKGYPIAGPQSIRNAVRIVRSSKNGKKKPDEDDELTSENWAEKHGWTPERRAEFQAKLAEIKRKKELAANGKAI